MYRLITTILVLFMLGGCGIEHIGTLLIAMQQVSTIETMETVKQSRGEADMQIYSYPYDTVYAATLIVAAEQGLKVVEQDKKKGEIMLSYGGDIVSFGDRIAVFLTSVSDSETEVEIISKQAMSSMSKLDWTNTLFYGISARMELINSSME